MSDCHRDGGAYWLTGRHNDTCDNPACNGCIRCTSHCTCRNTCPEHVPPTELTAPACIARTRADLADIATLAALMPDEAQHRGVNSEAAWLAGPAADPEAWSWHKITARQGHIWHASLIEDDDDWHPLTVTGRWEMMIRDDYGPDTTRLVTIHGAIDYLDRRLTRLANDPRQDFPLFAAEIRACRAHLEAVLHDSRIPERGAPCPECGTDTDKGPPLVKHYRDDDPSGASDWWDCPRCCARWTEADYRHRVGTRYLHAADRLTASQAALVCRVTEGTIRVWAQRGLVTKRGRDGQGRMLYDVASIRATRDTQEQLA